MSAAIAAVAVGAAGVGVGVMSSRASSKAAGKAADAQMGANAQSASALADQLDFDKAQWEQTMSDVADLEYIFGPVRENLGNYYKNLSPEMYQMMGKEAIESEYKRSNETIDAMFSNNGMFNSGQMLNAKVALEANRELLLGQNQQQAQSQYASEQSQWLSMGLNEQASMRGQAVQQAGMINNAYGNQANMAMQGGAAMANIYGQQANAWGQAASGGMQLAGYALGGGFGGKTTVGNPGNIGTSGGLAPIQGPMMSSGSFYSK